MKNGRFWLAVLVTGVVANVIDFALQGYLFQNLYYSKIVGLFRPMGNPALYVLADFVAVLVLAWFYEKVSSSFAGGAMGGAMYGLYTGVLINFPTWIMAHLTINNFTYHLAWFWTLYGIAWCVIAGAILAAIYKKEAPPSRA